MALKKQKRGGPVKSSVKRRSVNATVGAGAKSHGTGSPGQEQDAKRRLGNFEGKGEHAKVGSRTAGIVGQTKRAFRTDNKRTKSRASHGKPDKAR
jgi:hypothetical protein